MGLDARGVIAVIEILMYVPVLIVGAFLSFRHGFRREAGWIFLVILSLIRIIGGVTHVLSEHNPTNSTEREIYSIMESTGISPLLLATLGFLGTVAQYSLNENTTLVRAQRILGLVGTVGLILSVVGGIGAGDAKTQSDLDSSSNERHAGILLFLVLYVGVVAIAAYCWQNRNAILRYRRQLLLGVLATLPFLAVRVLYGILSAFAPSPFAIVDGQAVPSKPSDSGLSKFSFTSSEWGIYLIMSVLMEYAAVLIYAVVGIVTPLGKDVPDFGKAEMGSPSVDGRSEEYGMGPYGQPQAYGQQSYATR